MSRSIADLHPWLGTRVEQLLLLYAAQAPDVLQEEGTLRVVDTLRTTEEQARYFARGSSSIDGVTRWSLHQYKPGLAADVVPYLGDRPSWGETSAREKGRWALVGRLAEELGLGWGGRWTRPHDAPHVEVPEKQRIILLQEALEARGRSPGPLDGVLGPRTLAALRSIEKAAGLPRTVRADWSAVPPASWAAAHSEEMGPTV